MRAVGALALLVSFGASLADAQAIAPTRPLTQLSIDAWSGEDVLPQRSVISIAQTPDGYLWLGTYGGLVRFDGLRFVTHTAGGSEGLPSPNIHALAVDASGALFVGTSGGLSRLEKGRFTTLTTEDGLVGDFVRAVLVDRRGRIWVGTNDGLSRIEKGVVRTWTTANGLPNGVIRALAEDPMGVVWAGTSGGGVVRFEEERLSVLSTREGLPGDSIFALLATRDGSLWIGTNGAGLCRLRRGKIETFGAAEGLPHPVVWSLHEDSVGTVWVGTYGGGVSRFEDGRFSSIDKSHGLPDDYVRALASDREGSLWVGTYAGGLARLRDSHFVVYGRREGLAADFARALVETRDGSLWMGTTGGGLCSRAPTGTIRCWGKKEGLADDVRALHEDASGRLFVGTSGEGLFVRDGELFRELPFPPEVSRQSITAITSDGRGGLWIGTNGIGLVHRSASEQFQIYRRSDGLGSDFVVSVLLARDKTVWVGTDGGGLSALRGDAITNWRRREGLAGDVVFSLYEDGEGVLWAGTSGGLSYLGNRGLSRITTAQGLAEDVVFGIAEDGAGALWLSGNRGISRLERSELAKLKDGSRGRLDVVVLGRADGMRTSECSGLAQPSSLRARDGRLYFPTTAGVVGFDPAHLHASALAPPVVIEEVSADGERISGTTVAPGRRRWEFRYTAPTFLAAQRVRFRYRLEGFDTDWIDAGTSRTAQYTGLPPGSYTFKVTAASTDGAWNEQGASVSLVLSPHFWQTRLFLSLVAATILGMTAGAWALRVRQLRRRQRELIALVDERTRQLVAEKELSEGARREAEIHREAAETATRHKGELLSIAAHDLKTPLQVVVGYGELMGAAIPPEKSREYAGRTVQAAQRMLEIIERLLDSEALAHGRIPLQAEAVDVSELVRESVSNLRRRAEEKHQRLELEAPEPSRVDADPRLLRQIVDNLLDNAIKYSPQSGSIRVVVRGGEGHVRIEVCDEGPGLSPDDYAHLFERFGRLSAQPTGGESSTGLGLSIVKQLVGLHGGRVWAESEGLGRGTTFIVELDDPQGSPVSP